MKPIVVQTVILVIVFSVGYLYFIVRKTARRQLDIYDLLMLSTVAVIPSAFVIFPELAHWIAGLAGVEFPFVVMFGILFAILFIFVHRITVKVHRLELDNRLLIQELSLLRESGSSLPSQNRSYSRSE